MPDINFQAIAARCGSQSNAFEELCCQLARSTCPVSSTFLRFRGAGGDGGVECTCQEANGSLTGWQAKFVFDVKGLMAQADKSLQTALSVHKDLNKYIVCFPFDPTGKTARRTKKNGLTKSENEKLDAWVKTATKKAKDKGRCLTIELWPASKLQSLLISQDSSGGMRHYFFHETILSKVWFKNHLTAAVKAAGPRYSPKLNVETNLWKWFSAFGEGATWRIAFETLLNKCLNTTKNLRQHVESKRDGPLNPNWPKGLLKAGQELTNECDETLSLARELITTPTENGLNQLSSKLTNVHMRCHTLDLALSQALEDEHGEGKANSKRFRTFMSEHMVSFPAANVDVVRETKMEFDGLSYFISTPSGFLAFKRVYVLSGAGGSGKTHGICDAALKRFDDGALTCVLLGHQFSGLPDEWTRLVESLGLPPDIGRDCVIDALNAAGEASGKPLVFCIDALNETRPIIFWFDRFLPLAHEFERRPFLKLCVSCRTSYLSACLPKAQTYPLVEHHGFTGIERDACNAFFRYYGLEPPLIPILQLELSNPMYLKLVCETLKFQGLERLPNGWYGLSPIIDAFLRDKERQFAIDHGGMSGAGVVAGSLLAIASAIASSGNATISWSNAERVICERRPQAARFPVLEWLVKADLLIEDGPTGNDPLGTEPVLRPAFERFGEFLIATELLPKSASNGIANEFSRSRNIQSLFATLDSVKANTGVIYALTILLPEKAGIELPDLIKDPSIRKSILVIAMQALPCRTSDSLSQTTGTLAKEALADDYWVMNSLLAVAAHTSVVDAYWIDDLLTSKPIAVRDKDWCTYLHRSYENNGIVKRLIDAASDFDLKKLDTETAKRWAVVLIWFTAAADRRVKDQATRASISILRAKPDIIPHLVNKFLNVDDDELRERILLCAYGALIISRDKSALSSIAEALLTEYESLPSNFQNALIRDHIRCIGELARELGCLDDRFEPLIASRQQQNSDWPLTLISADQLKRWRDADGAVCYVANSCMADDFNHYSIGCMEPWMHQMNKMEIGGWILKNVVEGLELEAGQFDEYDEHMVNIGGGGRSKPVWAERIGKKHQWLGMYKLASRLHDKLERKEHSWNPRPLRIPLILQEERKLDPTLSRTVLPKSNPSDWWWLHESVDLEATKDLDFNTWVMTRGDLPNLERLLQPTSHGGQRWIILTTLPSWNDSKPDRDYNAPYREVWMHLRGYLVPKTQFKTAIIALRGRNFFGQWLPTEGRWLHTFAGEYPWATSCNTEPDSYLGADGAVEGSNLKMIHASNNIIAEWEYDATLPTSLYLEVPAKCFFAPGDLWWNGTDGFATKDGKNVFLDPCLQHGGPSTLLADVDDLWGRLEKIGYRLIWALLGEKLAYEGEADKYRRITFSQIAYVNDNCKLEVSKRNFFKNYELNQGFLKPKKGIKNAR